MTSEHLSLIPECLSLRESCLFLRCLPLRSLHAKENSLSESVSDALLNIPCVVSNLPRAPAPPGVHAGSLNWSEIRLWTAFMSSPTLLEYAIPFCPSFRPPLLPVAADVHFRSACPPPPQTQHSLASLAQFLCFKELFGFLATTGYREVCSRAPQFKHWSAGPGRWRHVTRATPNTTGNSRQLSGISGNAWGSSGYNYQFCTTK